MPIEKYGLLTAYTEIFKQVNNQNLNFNLNLEKNSSIAASSSSYYFNHPHPQSQFNSQNKTNNSKFTYIKHEGKSYLDEFLNRK